MAQLLQGCRGCAFFLSLRLKLRLGLCPRLRNYSNLSTYCCAVRVGVVVLTIDIDEVEAKKLLRLKLRLGLCPRLRNYSNLYTCRCAVRVGVVVLVVRCAVGVGVGLFVVAPPTPTSSFVAPRAFSSRE